MEALDPNKAQTVEYCIPIWLRDEQIKVNIAKISARIEAHHEPRTDPIAIVCFGPSLNDTWEKIKDFKYVMTCSGAHKFLIERGVIPTWHLDVDPREHKIKLLGQPHKDVEYLIASTCNPKLIDHLQGFNVKLWHVFSPKDASYMPRGEWMITGGCSAGVRCLTVARFLGFREQHIFGMDGSQGASGKHAAAHPNQAKESVPCPYDGITYQTTPSFLEAARNTFHELNMMTDVTPVFYGEGLVQHMARNWKREPAKDVNPIIAFDKPVLISPEMVELNRKLHTERLEYGVAGAKYAHIVLDLVKRFATHSVLDFGCGKGYLGKHLDFPIWEYDPAVPGKDSIPRPADIVMITDVMEHIEPERLGFVLEEIQRCTKRVAFFAIHRQPAKKQYADGRNTHLIQETPFWWLNKLSDYFRVEKDGILQTDPLLLVLAYARTVVKEVRAVPPAKDAPIKLKDSSPTKVSAKPNKIEIPEAFDKRSHKFVLEEWVKMNGWKKGAEIGVLHGLTFFHLLKRCPDLKLIGVDLFEAVPEKAKHFDEGGRSYKNFKLETEFERIEKSAKERFPSRARVLKMASVKAAANVPDHSLDFVFIDACHMESSVRADIEAWRPKVRPGGVLCGHDIHMPSVKAAVDALCHGYTVHKQAVWAQIQPVGTEEPALKVFIPFASDRNLGREYNAIMESLPDNGWACLMDHDAMFTTSRWHAQLLSAIKREPEATFVCVSNRIGFDGRRKGWQRADINPDEHDMAKHRKLGEQLSDNGSLLDVTEAPKLSTGVLILISKKSWLAMNKFEDGLRAVDYMMHLALRVAGRKVFCIEGLYLYHWKRGDGQGAVKGTPMADWQSAHELASRAGLKLKLDEQEIVDARS